MIPPEQWRPADGIELSTNALRVVKEQNHSLAVTAGPGAGKTEMLAQRADFLLRTGTCPFPKRILAISFKVDASHNLKERVRSRCGFTLSTRFDSHTFHAFAKRIIERYRPLLVGEDAVDEGFSVDKVRCGRTQLAFDDLVPLAIRILTISSFARNALRQTYSDVFLDEFQDCTGDQYNLIKLAFGGTAIRLTAVGDSKQRIMDFAHALKAIFTTFASDFSAIPLTLLHNYRSKSRLLRMQNKIIQVLDSDALLPEDLTIGDDGLIQYLKFENSEQEAEFLADQISQWINEENLSYSEIAVLVSKQVQVYAKHLMNELKKRQIPFKNEQNLQNLLSEPVVKLIINYLLVLFGRREPDAWINLMNILVIYNEQEESKVRQDWQHFIKSERKQALQLTPSNISFHDVWKFVSNFCWKIGTNNLMGLSPEYSTLGRLYEIVRELKHLLSAELGNGTDLLKTLAQFSNDRAIRILTIHKSKGLEFDTVVILGVEKEHFWADPVDERCAFFVGVSRAKRRLLLTCCDYRARPTSSLRGWGERRTPHSEFLGYVLPFVDHPQ